MGQAGRLGSTRVTPVVIALIVVNVVAYLYEQQHLTFAFETKYFLVPALVHSHWYSLLTSAFLHANGMHILLNMVSLAIVGPPVEAEVGRLRFLVIYLLSALGGSVAFYLLAPAGELGVGASGAIFGLLGAYFVIAKLRGWPTQSILALLVVNVLYSFTGGIAWQAHLGGLVTGALTTAALAYAPRGRSRVAVQIGGLVGVAVLLAVATAVKVTSVPALGGIPL